MGDTREKWIQDISEFFSDIGKSRKSAPLREYAKILWSKNTDDVINLGPGYPDHNLWPIEGISFKIRGESDIVLTEKETATALQYSDSRGMPTLRQYARDLILRIFQPPGLTSSGDGERDVIIMGGGQDALSKVLELLLNPGKDCVIIEETTYPSMLNQLDVLKAEVIKVPADTDGLDPKRLREILTQRNQQGLKKPKFLYVNPTGQNPVGYVMSMDRMKQIYRVAQEFNFLLVVDDPYYWLSIRENQGLRKTFLSIDTDGRVIRVDSFSKVLSPGFRTSVVTAPKPVVNKLEYHNMLSIQSPNGIPQMFLIKLFQRWGVEGFIDYAVRLAGEYEKKRKAIIKAAERWLSGIAEWSAPSGGMFMWLKLMKVKDTKKILMDFFNEYNVMMIPGGLCCDGSFGPCPYIRVAFSITPEDQINRGFQLLAEFVRDYEE